MTTYHIQSRVKLTGAFTNASGTPTDPSSVTLKVRRPDGSVTTVTGVGGGLANPIVGTWTYDITLDQEGKWYYRYEGTAGLIAAGEASFTVPDSAFYVP